MQRISSRFANELADFLAARVRGADAVGVAADTVTEGELTQSLRRFRDAVEDERERERRHGASQLPPDLRDPKPPVDFSYLRDRDAAKARLVDSARFGEGKAPLSWLGSISRALADVARSLAFGGTVKYADNPNGWRDLPNASMRHRDAALRHLMADLRGERLDPDQGLPHVTIAALRLLMAAECDQGFDDAPRYPSPPVVPGVLQHPER